MIYREAGQFRTTYASDQAIFPIPQDRWFVVFAAVAAFVIPPLAANEYWLQAVLIPFLIGSPAANGLNLRPGCAGQLSLGTGGFMAVGAYSAFKLTTALPQLNIVVVFLLSGLIAAGVGLVFGIPSLRIKGFYLAVATLAAQFFLLWLFNKVPWFVNYASSGTIMAPNRSVLGVIIGGLGSILGSFLGAAFIVLVPIFLTNAPQAMGLSLPVALQKQFELMVFGGLIIFFLIVEPHGLARLWQITKEKLRLWPFPH